MFPGLAPAPLPAFQTPLPVSPPPVDEAALRRSRLADTPDDMVLWILETVARQRAGDADGALRCCNRALALRPDHAEPWSQRSFLLGRANDHAAAYAAIRRALALAPDDANALFNLNAALQRSGDYDECRAALDRLIRLVPDHAGARWGRAQIRLHDGHYEGGLADYEARYGLAEYHYRLHRGPRWDGGPLDGKIVMITTEQGFGDTLLMARYLPMLKARGARRVIVECAPELRRLLAGLEASGCIDAFIPRNAAPTPIYHVHSSIMSLPLRFGTRVDTVPPPLRPVVPEEARAKAERLLGSGDGKLRVGIVWSGNLAFPDNAMRATSLDRFLPILEVPGVQVFSLQKGPLELDLERLPAGTPITALGPHLTDFADTAAVLERLDLVVMTDSSVAHLAGSLDVPVWNLVQHVPYWVYRRTGDRSPWYGSMRLYRQGPDEDWGPVFDRMLSDLSDLAARRRKG